MKYSELKENARDTIRPYKKTLYKATFFFLLIELIFLIASSLLSAFDFENTSSLIDTLSDFLMYPIILASIAMIARIYQGESIAVRDMFKNYTSSRVFWKSIWAYVLPSIYLLLWTLPFTIVALISAIPMFFDKEPSSLAITIFIISVIIGVIISLIKIFQYSLSPYILADNSDTSVNESINISKQLMKGNKRRLFVLGLTFIGWFILVPLTLGLLLIWLLPYYNATVYEFYNQIKRTKAEQADSVNEG